MSTTINKRLGEAMDAYVDWRELCRDVQRAYERWARAPRSQALECAVLVGCLGQ